MFFWSSHGRVTHLTLPTLLVSNRGKCLISLLVRLHPPVMGCTGEPIAAPRKERARGRLAFFSRAEERVELLETAANTQPTVDSHSEDYDETPPRARHLWWEDAQAEAEADEAHEDTDVDEAVDLTLVF